MHALCRALEAEFSTVIPAIKRLSNPSNMSDSVVPHDGLTHLKTYDVKDSNVELIGSKLDHQVKHDSAQSEPAWKRVGDKAGLFIWRMEQFEVVEWPKERYGQFHQGDSYIVLHSRKVGEQDQLQHDIFFWLGEQTSQDEAGTAAYKTVELDEYLLGKATQHRELQASPSSEFLSLFPRITILHGGVRTGFRHVEEEKPEETLRLFRVTKAPSSQSTASGKTSTLVKQVEPTWKSLLEDDCFILDRGTKVMIWQGKKASPIEKAKAAQVAHDMTLSRQAQTEVIAQSDSRAYAFLEPLGGKTGDAIPSASSKPDAEYAPNKRPRKLFRLSDESGSMRFDVVKDGGRITKNDLDSNDIFLLDQGLHIWIWQGANASANEKAIWLKVAQAYVRSLDATNAQAHLSPVAKVVDGHESPAFRAALDA